MRSLLTWIYAIIVGVVAVGVIIGALVSLTGSGRREKLEAERIEKLCAELLSVGKIYLEKTGEKPTITRDVFDLCTGFEWRFTK